MSKTQTVKVGVWRFVVIVRRNKTGRQTWLGEWIDWLHEPYLTFDGLASWTAVWAIIGFAAGGY